MNIKRGYEIIVIFILVILAFAVGYNTSYSKTGASSLSSLNYDGSVCIYKNGELVECSHNLLYDNGKNITRELLGIGSNAPILNISLCNATAGCATPVAAGSEAFNTFTNCGLSGVQGTYATINNAAGGNWSVARTFTSTCDSLNINSTRLTNSTGGIFAGNTFTLVTLQTNDQLTINWTLMVS